MLSTQFREEVTRLLGIEKTKTLSSEEEQAYYAAAFRLYSKRAYRKATHLFTLLVLSQPFSPSYWRGLASSKQMAREYEEALRAWSLLALLEEDNPQPHFHAAECLFALHEKEEAKKALESALSLNPSPELQLQIETLAPYVNH